MRGRRRILRVEVLIVGWSLLLLTPPPGGATSPPARSGHPAATSAGGARSPQAGSSSRYSARRAQARRERLARARAAARARELHELSQPLFREDETGRLVPVVRAAAAIVYDPVNGEVLWQTNAQDQRSIASLTKVMTALVFLEPARALDQVVTVTRADIRGASTTYLRVGQRVSLDELMHLLLIGSDNGAARVLARVSPWGSRDFVARMNAKAAELGLDSTRFADPSGLDPGNVSSAYDLSRLIAHAAENEYLSAIMRTPAYTIVTRRGSLTVHNTNKLVGEVTLRGGKTGFIRQAGYCLATLVQLPQGHPVSVVILGARSSLARFIEARHLFDWLSSRAQEWLLGAPVPQPHAR